MIIEKFGTKQKNIPAQKPLGAEKRAETYKSFFCLEPDFLVNHIYPLTIA
ncbi:hypothetical protein SAMN04488057_10251 [Cyclobacterium lianum]|uniref:Uncharacterized protein n=1 Tax=Cyclobacterium lianum TaxID=388280 RepID=A0A1M7JK57_9BACT|nr:hypothetical protein SAMN04488057_10251 [Cyclobacterium lianum]